jgi:hypothetical protein
LPKIWDFLSPAKIAKRIGSHIYKKKSKIYLIFRKGADWVALFFAEDESTVVFDRKKYAHFIRKADAASDADLEVKYGEVWYRAKLVLETSKYSLM